MLMAAPESSFNEIKETVENELKRPIEDIFESFEIKPLASASLA